MVASGGRNQSPGSSSKKAALAELEKGMRAAFGSQRRLVFGEGDTNASLAIVGEAPGRTEEMTGHPFVGLAGHLLDSLLSEMAIRRQAVWVTNLVKWRPAANSRTTAPRASEVSQSLAWLKKELEVVDPAIILCLGNLAARAVINRNFKMTEKHGRWYRSFTGSWTMATFHPAYVVRQGRLKREQVLGWVRRDLQNVKLKYEESLRRITLAPRDV